MINIALAVSMGGFALAIATFFIGRMSGAKTDGREMGKIESKLEDILERIGKLEKSMLDLSTKSTGWELKVTRNEQNLKNAHYRIDGNQKTIRELESKLSVAESQVIRNESNLKNMIQRIEKLEKCSEIIMESFGKE